MRLRILLIVSAVVALTFAYPDYNRPVVSTKSGEEHMAGQLVIQLAPSQRGLVRLSKSEGVALFGVRALDQLSSKWKVEEVEPLLRKPRPTDIDRKYGLDLQYVVQFGVDQDVAPVLADYQALAEVEIACPNGVMRFDEAPNDPLFSSQWHWQNLNAVTAWGIAKGDSAVLSVPLDDGLDIEHEDVKANLWINSPEDINGNGVFDTLWYPDGDLDGTDQDGNGFYDDVIGYDFVGGDPIPQCNDGDDHGTHCWGDMNAVTNNGVGVAGPAWNNRSFAVRCGTGGGITIGAAIQAINYGMNENVWSISMSFGSGSPYQPMANACQAAWDYGAVLFGSAGNDYVRAQRYPGCYNGVENVAASNTSDEKADFSNYGPWIDITAPGVGIFSTVPGSYGTMDGTSMSCPLAAGVASWVKSWNPALTNQEAIDIMHEACDTMPDSLFRIGELGAGRVSLGNIVLTRYFCDLKLQSWRFNDQAGNNNGRPDPGETVSLIVTYANTPGFQNATSVTATLACSDTNVQIVRTPAGFPDIPAGGNGNCSADSFVITVPTSVPPQYLGFWVTAHATPNPAYPLTLFTVKCGEPRVLIVDDDDGSDFEKYYTAACDSNFVLYDKYTVQTSGSPSSDTLRHYPVVVWFTGNATTNTLTATDRANLGTFLDSGGNLMIAGQNVAQELSGDPFLANYLHASFAEDSAGKIYIVGVPGDPITSNPGGADTMVLGGASGANNSKSADGIWPISGAIGCATYKDYTDTTVKSVIRYAGTSYKVVFFSCAFEAINHSVSRYLQKWTLMKRILAWFGEGIPPAIAQQMREPEVRPYALKVSPNPFRRQALVEFTAPVSGRMELRTYAADGRLVASETRTAVIGQHLSFKLDGAKLANGTYLVQVKTPAGVYAQKTAVLK
jgi:hypothetical protein